MDFNSKSNLKIKQEYTLFFKKYFKQLRIKVPLFYSWNYSLRFDLQKESADGEVYFQEVNRRATMLFESVFNDNDNVFIVLQENKYKRGKIRFSNFIFNQIQTLNNNVIYFINISESIY